MIFTIEPMINLGKYETKTLNDGWTAVTKDKSLSAQFEHTIGVTKDGCEILLYQKIMIDRYSRKEIKSIWEDKNKYSIWLEIELAAAEAMEKLKIIPRGVSKKVKAKAKINVKRILQIEEKVKHDVIAFLTSITEKVGKDARFLHKGMTSSDVLDTCFNLQLKQSGEILLKDIDQLLSSIKRQAIKHKYTLCIGRSHGIHAEPTTFGLKMLTFYQEFLRNKKRLIKSIKEISTCAISGAVGTFANVDPAVERYVAKKLKLSIEPVSTQIIPRDRHAHFFQLLELLLVQLRDLRLKLDIFKELKS